ncbi:hypothetical protein JKP88DRAFT_275820 [Tribonema minus]|uniref:Uncharacterized protein n=1 Tax=Tribonema minus TaxID=303371 RepID=A0A835ZGN8_9STRA|nr:hypothetical protein JKP88DRAFT_275820 [Tribonema minus]
MVRTFNRGAGGRARDGTVRHVVTTRKRAKAATAAASASGKALETEAEDVWRRAFDFLPGGHYLLLATVSCAWRRRYETRPPLPAPPGERRPDRSSPLTEYSAIATPALADWALDLARADASSSGPRAWGDLHEGLARSAARRGDGQVLRRLHAARPLSGPARGPRACYEAARGGHAGTLDWLRREARCEWGENIYYAAARGGHVGVLDYCAREGCPFEVPGGAQLEAAAEGHVEAVLWLAARGCEPSALTFRMAAGGGHLETLRALRWSGCPWNSGATRAAAFRNRVDALRWLLAEGCPAEADATAAAAAGGHLEALGLLHAADCPRDASACEFAACGGRVETLRWLLDGGCPADASACASAAGGGFLEALQLLRDRGCPWDRRVLACACDGAEALARACDGGERTQRRRLEVVDWALEHGCPRDEDVDARILRLRRRCAREGV